MREVIWNDILELISIYEKTRDERDAMKGELQQKDDAIAGYREQIKELEKQIDNLKLKNAFLSTSGDEEAKEKIDRMIREIDRCISLLEG